MEDHHVSNGKKPKAEPAGQEKIETEESSHSGRFTLPPTPSAYYYTEANSTVNQARPLAEKPAAQRAMSESDSLARDIKDGHVSGFVGSGTTLTGEANFKGMLRVDGHLSGHVSSEKGTLIVSAGAQVDATSKSPREINGRINGDIFATERVELGRAAEVYGNIETPILVVEQGAIFEGNCHMARPAPAAAVEAHEALITGRERADDLLSPSRTNQRARRSHSTGERRELSTVTAGGVN